MTSEFFLSNAAQSAHQDQDKHNYSGECKKILEPILLHLLMLSVSHIKLIDERLSRTCVAM